jgi:putative peptidoglycan lipid II flippase
VQSIALGFVAGQAVLLLVLSAQLRWVARSTRSDGGAGPDAAVARTTFAAAALVLAGWAGGMLNIVVDWLMASTLDSGRVAALRFSFQVMSIPIDLFSAAAGVALLPALSRAVQDRDGEAERRTMVYAMRLLAVLVVPAAAGLAVAARPLVAGLFERQAFDAQATSLTAAALRFYAPGIVFRALMTLWMSHLYAQRRVAVVATIGLGSVVVNAAANWLFMSWLGHVGIALSTTVVHLLAAVLLLMADRRALPLILDVAVGRSWLRAVIAAVVMSVTLWLFTGTSRIEALSPLMEMFLVVSCGAASFAASLALLRGGELGEIWKAVRGR